MTVAIGFFDGVHLGHQAILKGADIALTFKNHPLSFLAPERAPRLIMSSEERAKAIQSLGVQVKVIDFNAEVANLSPEDFLRRLKNFADPLKIRCGANWRFGKGGKGDADYARAHGIETTVVPYAIYKDEPISSTRIRAALEAGKIEDATAMLARPYRISGEVFAGKGKGKDLGYPTVNVRTLDEEQRTLGAETIRLPLGVYQVEIGGVNAIANYGFAPTFEDAAWKSPVWEIHLLPPTPSPLPPTTYQTFSLVRFIRPERKFASLDDLKRQIAADIALVV